MPQRRQIDRRRFLATSAAAVGATAFSAPFISRAASSEPLRVGTYGGYFQDSFDQHIYPDFTRETGIEVESIGEPTGEAWLVQLETAARAGPGACGRLDDGADAAPEGAEHQALGFPGRSRSAQCEEPSGALRAPLRRRHDLWGRRRLLVHHPRHQHRRLSRDADELEGALGPRQRGPPRAPRSRDQFVPAGDHRHDLVRRDRDPRHRGGDPEGHGQAGRGQARTCVCGTATKGNSSRRWKPARSRWASTITMWRDWPRPTASR